MSYTVANQAVSADTSTGKMMGTGNTSGNKAMVKGFLAPPCAVNYQQVSAGTPGPATGSTGSKNSLPMAGAVMVMPSMGSGKSGSARKNSTPGFL